MIPVVIQVIDWFIANEPSLEKDGLDILAAAKDVLARVHTLRADVAPAASAPAPVKHK